MHVARHGGLSQKKKATAPSEPSHVSQQTPTHAPPVQPRFEAITTSSARLPQTTPTSAPTPSAVRVSIPSRKTPSSGPPTRPLMIHAS